MRHMGVLLHAPSTHAVCPRASRPSDPLDGNRTPAGPQPDLSRTSVCVGPHPAFSSEPNKTMRYTKPLDHGYKSIQIRESMAIDITRREWLNAHPSPRAMRTPTPPHYPTRQATSDIAMFSVSFVSGLFPHLIVVVAAGGSGGSKDGSVGVAWCCGSCDDERRSSVG